MDTQWTELVHVEAYYFDAGQQPWTEQDWAQYSYEGPDPCDPNNTIRTAPDDPTWWQDGYLWWTPDDYVGEEIWHARTPIYEYYDHEARVLTHDVVRFSIQPLNTGAWPEPAHDNSGQSLLTWETESYSLSGTFQHEQLGDLKALTDTLRQPKNGQVPKHIAVVTVWQCEIQRDYWNGEEDYDWGLIGHIAPGATSVAYVPFKQATI